MGWGGGKRTFEFLYKREEPSHSVTEEDKGNRSNRSVPEGPRTGKKSDHKKKRKDTAREAKQRVFEKKSKQRFEKA